MSTVVVLGASPKPERYSNRVVQELLARGHHVIPVHPAAESIHGVPCAHTLSEVNDPVDTLTLYLSPQHTRNLIDDILALHPHRILMNPGTETPELADRARADSIEVREGCTLVLLRTDQF